MTNNNDKDIFRSAVYFLMIILSVAGLVGGIGWLGVISVRQEPGATVPLVGLMVTAFMVWPVIKEMVRRM